MNPLDAKLSGCGPGVRARNAHLFGTAPAVGGKPIPVATQMPDKRLRQSSKPTMNKIESDYYQLLLRAWPKCEIKIQAMKLKLANGLTYCPDFIVFGYEKLVAIETKGAWIDGDSIPKLKMAAATWPKIEFRLVWREGNIWKEQIVLP
jgi:hypothetical protein